MSLKNNDFFRDFFIRYKFESHTTHETMEEFCTRYHIPFADFMQWYKSTRPDPSKYTEEEKREHADAVDKLLYMVGALDRKRESYRQAKEKTRQLEEQIKLLQELLELLEREKGKL